MTNTHRQRTSSAALALMLGWLGLVMGIVQISEGSTRPGIYILAFAGYLILPVYRKDRLFRQR